MSRRIFVAGATSYTGMAVLRWVAQSSRCGVVAHARAASADKLAPLLGPQITASTVELSDPQQLAGAMSGCEVVLQLVGTTAKQVAAGVATYEGVDLATTQWLLAGAKRAGVPRVFFLSSILVSPHRRVSLIVPPEFFRVKYQAERAVRTSGLEWTIWRPGFITGPGRGRPGEAIGAAVLGTLAATLGALRARELAARLRPITADQLATSFENTVFSPRPNRLLCGRALWETVSA